MEFNVLCFTELGIKHEYAILNEFSHSGYRYTHQPHLSGITVVYNDHLGVMHEIRHKPCVWEGFKGYLN